MRYSSGLNVEVGLGVSWSEWGRGHRIHVNISGVLVTLTKEQSAQLRLALEAAEQKSPEMPK